MAFPSLRSTRVRAALRTNHGRYVLSSVVQIGVAQVLFFVLVAGWSWRPLRANMATVAVLLIPSYLATANFVWADRKTPWRRGLPPFAAAVVAQFVLTSAVVWVTARLSSRWSNASARAVFLDASILSVLFGVWILRFLVMDRIVFRRTGDSPEPKRR